MKMELLELTNKLISIPSYVDKKTNEKEVGEFVFRYLKQFPFLTNIRKQKVEDGRFNVVASDGFAPKLLLCGHLDTVEPRGWKEQNPFNPHLKGNRLYGLGSMDMKAGIAAILTALKGFKKTKGLMLLFYCDEEYDFKGMEKFAQEYGNRIKPKLAVCAEPTDLKIWNGARGIIKVSFDVLGKTAPASRPDKGKNAILGLIESVSYLTKQLTLKYKSRDLGVSTCNIAAITGGLNAGKEKQGKFVIDKKGDAVADIAGGLLDIRAGHLKLNAKIVRELLAEFLSKNGFRLSNFIIYHDLGAFYSKRLKLPEKILRQEFGKAEYLNLRQMGYQDIQIINAKLGALAFSFGPIGANRHQPNEWVDIRTLDKVKTFYQCLIDRYCSF
jgi:acetylornithine deacetylase/succinyl-diaminopimelate desuccinylase-like protein